MNELQVKIGSELVNDGKWFEQAPISLKRELALALVVAGDADDGEAAKSEGVAVKCWEKLDAARAELPASAQVKATPAQPVMLEPGPVKFKPRVWSDDHAPEDSVEFDYVDANDTAKEDEDEDFWKTLRSDSEVEDDAKNNTLALKDTEVVAVEDDDDIFKPAPPMQVPAGAKVASTEKVVAGSTAAATAGADSSNSHSTRRC